MLEFIHRAVFLGGCIFLKLLHVLSDVLDHMVYLQFYPFDMNGENYNRIKNSTVFKWVFFLQFCNELK